MESNNTTDTEFDSKRIVGLSSLLSTKGILLILSSNFIGTTYVIDRVESIIGRSKTCDFTIKDKLISKKHCKISIDEKNKFFIEDLNSTNSTFLNGKELKKKAQLIYGDRIVIGETILRFYYEEKIEKTVAMKNLNSKGEKN